MSLKLRCLWVFFVSIGLHLLVLVIPFPHASVAVADRRYPVGTVVRQISSFTPAQRARGFHPLKKQPRPLSEVMASAPTAVTKASEPPLKIRSSLQAKTNPVVPETSVLRPPAHKILILQDVPKPVSGLAPSSGSGGYASRVTSQVAEINSRPTTLNQTLEDSGVPKESDTQALPRYAENPPPRYPDVARRKGWSGKVEMAVRVDAVGRVHGVSVEQSSGYLILDRAALRAVRQWKFVPATRAGRNVVAEVVVPVDFRLPGGEDSKSLFNE